MALAAESVIAPPMPAKALKPNWRVRMTTGIQTVCAPPGLEHLVAPPTEKVVDAEKTCSDDDCSSTQVGTDFSRSQSEKDSASVADENCSESLLSEEDAEAKPVKNLPGTYPCLAFNGPSKSKGSVGHPNECKACAFYCFSYGGCRRGEDCDYCHMTHESKGAVKREEWKVKKAEKQRIMVEQQSSKWGWYPTPDCSGAQTQALSTALAMVLQAQQPNTASLAAVAPAPPGLA
mmetsp:Transcript_38062/g.89081  ORF Transcript_38062/g.89081 Transcript_38062/m.89081 type:complete len:233 (-) Transcript_38062:290-988(-)|eukprot:CAMPEP_0178427886 /NCGR_PEP_ID=MMETSP0689_2-20121128/29981_1 /TAXON_ID=160604 /ORGANISM="Amphidinium massartii, Strain CS-259" /LENGTH=232 /DNA_ID=CAMNT_0020049617 /DNA_START=117 /DNA_END=818 /DNA_ORIENTATION=+